MEDYADSWPKIVTQEEALKEINDHGANVAEFFEDLGDKVTYLSSDVLAWLGY